MSDESHQPHATDRPQPPAGPVTAARSLSPSAAGGSGGSSPLASTAGGSGGSSPLASTERFVRIVVNGTGAVFAVFFGQASLKFYLHTHSLVGGLFVIEQAWFVIAFLTRRPPRAVSRRLVDWLTAAVGTFGGLLLRPSATHTPWSVQAGFVLQAAGLLI